MATNFDNLGNFANMDNISTNAILARDHFGPIMNYKYVTSRSEAGNLFWTDGDTTPNIKWGLVDFENFNNPSYLNNDILCTIGEPNTFYTFGSFCVLITCLSGGRTPVSPIQGDIGWLLSDNSIYSNTNMNVIPNKNFMIYVEDTNTYYTLRFSIWQSGGGGRIAYVRQPITTPISNICFPAGTPIACNQANIPIEKINPDIHTIRNKKIVGITKTITQDKYLVCFEKDALGNNIPSQKTIMSKNHSILYKGNMRKAKEFVGLNDNIYKIKYRNEVLYNVLMEEYDKMIVNNLICETLHPENYMAKLYVACQNLNVEEQQQLIKWYNEAYKNKNNIVRK